MHKTVGHHALIKKVLFISQIHAEKALPGKTQELGQVHTSSLFAYKEAPQVSLGLAPFELLYGRIVRRPMQILYELLIWEDNT